MKERQLRVVFRRQHGSTAFGKSGGFSKIGGHKNVFHVEDSFPFKVQYPAVFSLLIPFHFEL